MALQATQLYIQAAPLPATFKGTPNDLLTEMIKRMRIVSPAGTNFIYTGDVEPASNVGPWLRNGTQWWVWDDTTKAYIPLDISASMTIPFFIGNTVPAGTNPPVWLKTTKDATDLAPTDYGDPLGWYLWDGTEWSLFTAINQGITSGNTAARPTSPRDLELYYDTDIQCLIWWERAMWRTVSGSPGDVKAVSYPTLALALAYNPGWAVFGGSGSLPAGRTITQATKDAGGANPLAVLDPLIPQLEANSVSPANGAISQLDTTGGTITEATFYALWHLYKL